MKEAYAIAYGDIIYMGEFGKSCLLTDARKWKCIDEVYRVWEQVRRSGECYVVRLVKEDGVWVRSPNQEGLGNMKEIAYVISLKPFHYLHHLGKSTVRLQYAMRFESVYRAAEAVKELDVADAKVKRVVSGDGMWYIAPDQSDLEEVKEEEVMETLCGYVIKDIESGKFYTRNGEKVFESWQAKFFAVESLAAAHAGASGILDYEIMEIHCSADNWYWVEPIKEEVMDKTFCGFAIRSDDEEDYLTDDGRWSCNINNAAIFDVKDSAVGYANAHGISDYSVVRVYYKDNNFWVEPIKEEVVDTFLRIPEQYPGGIIPGAYSLNDVVALLRKHKNDPEAIQFIADMMEE